MVVSSPQSTHRFFYEFFPPPRFLEMPAVGLAVSDEAVTALELVRRKDAFAVGRFGRRPLPAGAVSGGELRRKDEVVAALRQLKDELRLDFVNASLSEEKAYLFQTRIPRVPRKEIRSVLDFKLEDNVPVPAAEAVFDYRVITNSERGAEHLDVAVTVLPQGVVRTYTGLLAEAGLTPLSFEIEAQAIARAVVGNGDRNAYLIVHFGDAKTGLFIISDETVHFTSTALIGGATITEALARHFSLTAAEARDERRVQALLIESKDMRIFLSLTDALSVLKTEVNKLSVYWRTHRGQNGEVGNDIRNIILTGRCASLAGFADYLSLALGFSAEAGNVWRNICSFDEYIPPIPFEDSLQYAAAAGLALAPLK
jgi:type IV pilus assembly protein PilM